MKDTSRLKASVTRAQKKLDKFLAEPNPDQDKITEARDSLKRAQNHLTEHATQKHLPFLDLIPTKAQAGAADYDHATK